MSKVLVAMSGGVDSSVAAALLKEAGHKVVACTMQLWDYQRNPAKDRSPQFGKCCSVDDVYDARRVAEHLGFPFYVLNLQKEFKSKVVDPFINSYITGQTPIPCTSCNTFLKFDKLLVFAQKIGIENIATGHYARVVHDQDLGYLLLKGRDANKDQSYYLFELTQAQLSHIIFPVGEHEKESIREIAGSRGLVTAQKRESQEICFIPDGRYSDFIQLHSSQENTQNGRRTERIVEGSILFKDGTHMGTHSGIYQFTIGQRRGLGIAHQRALYVLRLDVIRNTVIVGYKEDLYTSGLYADRVNWISTKYPESPFRAKVRIRSRHEEAPALIHLEKVRETPLQSWGARVSFESPQMAVTPGQAAVFYDGDRVLGGGWITKRTNNG